MIQVCDLSFANSSITDTLGNYSLVSSGNITINGVTYPANTDPILYVTDSSYSCIEFGQTATYSNGAIIQAGTPDYGSENWAVEFRARVTSAMPDYYENYEIFYGCRAPYDNNGTTRMAGHWSISISISNSLGALEFAYVDHYDSLVIKDNLDFTSWHLYKVTKTAEEILTLHIDGVLVATINLEQQIGYKTHATLGSFALLGVVNEFPVDNRIQTNQSVRLADVKVYADPMGHAEKAISLDNLSRVFRNYNTWLSSQLSGQIGDGTLTIKVNGSTAGTFTANQSTAATANITVPTAVSELTNDSGYLTASSNLDASKLTSGTVDIERLPQGALERLVKVANEAARYALTTADVQLGDTVQQLDTGIMYVVTDIDHLDSAAGYTEYTAGTAASVPWSGVTGKPTFAAVATSGSYNDLSNKPTLESLGATSIPFHNSYPRCKNLGTTISDAQNTAIKNRTYDDLFIGDYWTINGVNWRIVAIDYYYNVGDTTNFDKGNVIVMPDTVLYSAQMNETNTTAGAYAGSLMRTQNLNSARTIAQNAFGSHLANHRINLASAVDASGLSDWAWYDSDGVELPNEVQIYGTRVWGSALKAYDVATQKQQFPLLALAPQFVNIRQDYWLQDVSSRYVSSAFSSADFNGGAGARSASNSFGVRPCVTLSYI